MCFILTNACHANEAVAVINATMGNFLGVLVTPFLILLFLGSKGQVDLVDTIKKLSLMVLVPLVVGQLAQRIFGKVNPRVKKVIGHSNKIILILIVYFTFCETFSSEINLSGGPLAALVLLIATNYIALLSLSFLLFNLSCLAIPVKSRPPAWFCSTQKTIAMGLPLIHVMFGGNSSEIGVITIPLLIVHPTQLIVGTFLIGWIKKWMDKQTINSDILENEKKEDVAESSRELETTTQLEN